MSLFANNAQTISEDEAMLGAFTQSSGQTSIEGSDDYEDLALAQTIKVPQKVALPEPESDPQRIGSTSLLPQQVVVMDHNSPLAQTATSDFGMASGSPFMNIEDAATTPTGPISLA